MRTPQYDIYLADFSHLKLTEADGWEEPLTELEIWGALKLISRDKTLCIDGLSYEVYLRQSFVFVPLLAQIFIQ